MVINPGKTTTLTIEFTMSSGMGGPHDFRIHLATNDPSEDQEELVVLSNWIE